MNLGCAAWGFRETPLEDQLTISHKLGMNLLELGIAGHPNDKLQADASESDCTQVADLFQRHGIKLRCASTGNDFTQPDATACQADLGKVMRVCDIAGRLGIQTLRIFAGFSLADDVTGPRWTRMIKCLNTAAEHAAKAGITLVVETHGGVKTVPGGVIHFHSASTRPDLVYQLMAELSPRIHWLFDPANLGMCGMNEDQILQIYRDMCPRIAVFHLKDFKRVSLAAWVPCACGEGQLNWEKLMAEFRNFTGPAFLEYENTEDIVDGLKRTLRNLFPLTA